MTDQSDTPPVLIRAARPDDELDAQLDLAERSFGPTSPADRDSRRQRLADRIADGRTLGRPLRRRGPTAAAAPGRSR